MASPTSSVIKHSCTLSVVAMSSFSFHLQFLCLAYASYVPPITLSFFCTRDAETKPEGELASLLNLSSESPLFDPEPRRCLASSIGLLAWSQVETSFSSSFSFSPPLPA
ncbi:hypothetical protein V6N13_099298 [Hibiscus sabdariffa]|uniref:Uncharacterized protein n=1 Tax=Hibiscus sabdariffa TaxID=183260 RepID=A0ABR2PZ91_9ROSI